jgi:APA family basic amino acid/polyamine antiporter
MADQESLGLIRAMGRWTLTALTINSIIGSGIFGLPSIAAGYLGKQSPLGYLIAGAGMAIVIGCFAEVASQFRQAGGPYLYAREAFGRITGIELGCFLLALKIIAAAAAADLFADYLVQFFPAVREPVPRLAVLTLLIGSVAIVNVRGVKSGGAANNVFTVAKLAPLITLAIAGGAFVLWRHSAAPPAAQSETSVPARNWFVAVLVLTFAYGGFEAAMVPMAEAKNPRRDAPFALFVGLGTVTFLYCGIQFVVVSLLPGAAATSRPLADAAQILWGSAGAWLISLGALISVYGYLTAMLLHTPRLMFAMGEKGDLPRIFSRVHPRYRTPDFSILCFAAVLWFLAAAGSFRLNVFLSSVARLLVYGFTCAALPALRRRRLDAQARRLPAGKLFAALGVAFVAVLATQLTRGELIVVALALGIAAADWIRRREHAA